MNKLILMLMMTILAEPVYSQNWQWSSSIAGSDADNPGSICRDTSDNIYVCGTVAGPTAYINCDTISINGSSDIYLVKFNANGDCVWAKVFGGNYNSISFPKFDGAQSIVYNAKTNSIVIVGQIVGSCLIDSILINSSGGNDREAFVASFDLDGNCTWAKSVGGPGEDYGQSICATESGDIYISGGVEGTATIDTITISNGVFLALFDLNGNCLWARSLINGPFGSSGHHAAARGLKYHNSDLYFIGYKFKDSLQIDTMQLVGIGTFSCIVAKFDSLGSVYWAKEVGTPSSNCYTLDIDSAGNVFFTGVYYGTAIFEIDTLESTGTSNMFLVKYDTNGNLIWINSSEATTRAEGSGITIDNSGDIYISGDFEGTTYFDSIGVIPISTQEMFLAKYDSDGNCIGVVNTGQAAGDAVTTLSDKSPIVTGTFSLSCVFGSNTLVGIGKSDVFVAKLDEITGTEGPGLRQANYQLLIYSNPNNGQCKIVLPDDLLTERDLILKLYDSAGRTVKVMPIDLQAKEISLEFNHEPKGIYFVSVESSKIKHYDKIIFE